LLVVILTCLLLVAVTTVIHYEVLRALNAGLPLLAIPGRTKLLVVMFVAFFAHILEMGIYGVATFGLVNVLGVGAFSGDIEFTLINCLYFSAETYTTLGFGDLTPVGPVRLIAGVEALNGLLLITWSASYTYLAMEKFWSAKRYPA
jgi:hypothetical protein